MQTQLWPPVVDPKTLTRQVWDAQTAQGLPGMGRALALYRVLLGQLPLEAVRGDVVLPRSRFLRQPDLTLAYPTFVGSHSDDWWLHGNAVHLVTSRDSYGFPATVRYFPAALWSISEDPDDPGRAVYYLRGMEVPARDVVHVQRGVDPSAPYRGMGVVEQHVKALDRAGLEEEAERQNLRTGGVPSVAVIAPQKELTEVELNEAAQAWDEKFGGATRRPGIFPNGTEVKPLSWSPNDQQMTLARQLTLTDVANIMNLDPYWLGAPGSSHKYQSPAPMFTALLRTALEGPLRIFEEVWGRAWLPYGTEARFRRVELTRGTLAEMVTIGATAVPGGLMTTNEWRAFAGLPRVDDPRADELKFPAEVPPALAAADDDTPPEQDPEQDPEDDDDTEEQA